MTRTLTLRSIAPVTHDTYRLTFDRPADLDYTPGQAAHMALDQEGWRDEIRSFTMTSLPGEEQLEFVIKSYPEDAEGHGGVTARIARLQPGDTMLLEDIWGAIEGKGDGVFIAGGAGVTPFIAILRDKLARKGTLKGNTLVFSNKAERDIILRDSFEKMPGLETCFLVTEEEDSPLHRGQIDADLLGKHVTPGKDICYICGPDAMLDDIAEALTSIDVPEGDIVMEQFD
ncbi:FAD-binding oxidoreductase [Salipiger bermudensis]|uniref:FAD-binding oxidoreductase n=1 Tax=Salipiger bermudensis TaxID=344736 RepID=UPI001A8E90E3|nr:FAD-binding oxidoreductase [Salipiger bermudensis]MBN9674411.1 flavodoxin reductase [Salipiger bermudensis]